MLCSGLFVRDLISDKINVRAIIASFEKEVICGKTINLNGIKFESNALEQINIHCIRKIYAYIITAGNVELQDTSVLNMFFADTWGTAYVDAGRDILKRIIRDYHLEDSSKIENGVKDRIFISDSFGPGFYGMDVIEVERFFKVLDGEKIGVKVTDSGFMLPLKSTTGFYIVVDDEEQLPGADCISCFSNIKGCQFCRVKTRVKS
jgi:hypothetical protein